MTREARGASVKYEQLRVKAAAVQLFHNDVGVPVRELQKEVRGLPVRDPKALREAEDDLQGAPFSYQGVDTAQ